MNSAHSDGNDCVRTVLADSQIVATIESLLTIPGRAWRHSNARAISLTLRDRFLAQDLRRRVVMIGWMTVVGMSTRVLLSLAFGPRIGWLAWVVSASVIATGLSMMTASNPVATAWVEWRRAHDPQTRRPSS